MFRLIPFMFVGLLQPCISDAQISNLERSSSVSKEVFDKPVLELEFNECFILNRVRRNSDFVSSKYFNGNGLIGIFDNKVSVKYWNDEEKGQYEIRILSTENHSEKEENITVVSGIKEGTYEEYFIVLLKNKENEITSILFDSDYTSGENSYATIRRAYPIINRVINE